MRQRLKAWIEGQAWPSNENACAFQWRSVAGAKMLFELTGVPGNRDQERRKRGDCTLQFSFHLDPVWSAGSEGAAAGNATPVEVSGVTGGALKVLVASGTLGSLSADDCAMTEPAIGPRLLAVYEGLLSPCKEAAA